MSHDDGRTWFPETARALRAAAVLTLALSGLSCGLRDFEAPTGRLAQLVIHHAPLEGRTSAFGTTDSDPEAVHCLDHSCRGDISGMTTHSSATQGVRSVWAITDQGSDDRVVGGTSYSNSKYVFQMLNNRVTRLHLLHDDISGAWNFHDPESIVRRNNTLAVVDAGNSWPDPPIGSPVEAGYCLPVTASSGTCTLGMYSASGTCGLRTAQATCTADTLCAWVAEPPSLRGRIGNSNRLRGYGLFRFTEPAVDTDSTSVATDIIPESTGTWIRFRFPSTCGEPGRPCGQFADLGVPGTQGHFNVEGAAVTAGNHLVLITKGSKRPEVNTGLSCSNGFWSTGGGAYTARRVDEGDTHVFYMPNFTGQAATGSADISTCVCTTGSAWRECTGCTLDATNSPLEVTYATRFNTHAAPYWMPYNSTDRPRVTAAEADATGFFFSTKVRSWFVPLTTGTPSPWPFYYPRGFATPTPLGSMATSCPDTVNWCHPEMESLAIIGRYAMFNGEEDNSYVNNMHNEQVTICIGDRPNWVGYWKWSTWWMTHSLTDLACHHGPGTWHDADVAVRAVADRFSEPNSALGFDGRDTNHVTIPSSDAFDFRGAMAVQTWVRVSSASGGDSRHVVSRAAGAGRDLQFQLHTLGAGNGFRFWLGTSEGTAYVDSARVSADRWVKVTAIWDGSRLQIYTTECTGEGSSLSCPETATRGGSTALGGTVVSSDEPMRVGHNPNAYSPFHGEIDEVRLHSCVLDPNTDECVSP